jgi:hypothetical protein
MLENRRVPVAKPTSTFLASTLAPGISVRFDVPLRGIQQFNRSFAVGGALRRRRDIAAGGFVQLLATFSLQLRQDRKSPP